MTELIKITQSEDRQLVSARELHEFLGIKKHFTQWFDDQKDWFAEGGDFEVINLKVNNSNGGRQFKIDYSITTEMAKELCMMSKVLKGKIARKYFIECEKQLLAPKEFNLEEALEMALIRERAFKAEQAKSKLLAQQNEVLAERAEYTDMVLSTENTHTTTVIANELGMSAIELNKRLETMGVQFKNASGNWIIKAKYKDGGYHDTKTVLVETSRGTQTRINLVWTEKGRFLIHRLMDLNKNQKILN